MAKNTMKIFITILLMTISLACFGQVDTPPLDPKPGDNIDQITQQTDTINVKPESAQQLKALYDGKYVNVDMLKLCRLVEQLTGEKLVFIGDVEKN